MTIVEERPVTLSEVAFVVDDGEKGVAIKKFIKDFNKMTLEKAKAMKEDLEKLDLVKLKDRHVVKVVDFMPKSASELNKVLVDVSLDSEETAKILEVVGRH